MRIFNLALTHYQIHWSYINITMNTERFCSGFTADWSDVWPTSGRCLADDDRTLFGRWSDVIWTMIGRCLADDRTLFGRIGRCLDVDRTLIRRCLDGDRTLFGRCLDGDRMLFGRIGRCLHGDRTLFGRRSDVFCIFASVLTRPPAALRDRRL